MAIFLYIVRHGEAEPISSEDSLRELTEHGRWEAKRTALWLKTQVPTFNAALVSPYVRAQQTLETISQFGPKIKQTETYDGLTPESSAQKAIDFLLAQFSADEEDQHIICVSHMPLVSYLIGELTEYMPIMATAGVAQVRIDLDNWKGHLVTLLSPDQML